MHSQQLDLIRLMTLSSLKHIIRHYKGSQDPEERLLRLRASSEYIRRTKLKGQPYA